MVGPLRGEPNGDRSILLWLLKDLDIQTCHVIGQPKMLPVRKPLLPNMEFNTDNT